MSLTQLLYENNSTTAGVEPGQILILGPSGSAACGPLSVEFRIAAFNVLSYPTIKPLSLDSCKRGFIPPRCEYNYLDLEQFQCRRSSCLSRSCCGSLPIQLIMQSTNSSTKVTMRILVWKIRIISNFYIFFGFPRLKTTQHTHSNQKRRSASCPVGIPKASTEPCSWHEALPKRHCSHPKSLVLLAPDILKTEPSSWGRARQHNHLPHRITYFVLYAKYSLCKLCSTCAEFLAQSQPRTYVVLVEKLPPNP